METLDEMRQFMQDRTAAIGADFADPDDDWLMLMCFQSKDGFAVMPLPNEFFKNGATKNMLVEFIREVLARFGAYRYGLLLNAHMASVANRDELERTRSENVRIKNLPGAREVLVLTIGDAEEENTWMATINRDGVNPPTLDEWVAAPNSESRFAGLNSELRKVRV